ncbi:hypothetical protein NX059_009890 [Plenodomus lindquistii]|nr:hypothetical protein NX059_009890 [Plenodomus lindquistii]
MSDNGGYAGLTPSPSEVNSCDSPVTSPLPASSAQELSANSVRRPSNGRVLVPQQTADTNARGPVTKVSSPQYENGPAVGGGGPTGKLYTIPPRPKPGRKPATDEPASKRKAQNRESQRAFRARKAAKVQELTEQVEQVEQAHRNALNERIAENDRLQNELRELRDLNASIARERDYWKEHFHRLKESLAPGAGQQQTPSIVNGQQMLYMSPLEDARHDSPRGSISSHQEYGTPKTAELLGCNGCNPEDCACIKEIANDMTFQTQLLTPMEAVPLPPRDGSSPMTGIEQSSKNESGGFEEQEIDFTAKFARATNRAPQQPNALLAVNDDPSKNQDCGWCEGHPELCLCKDASLRPDGPDGMAPAEIMEDVKVGPVISGPGSCDDCQRNPKQRAWCQRIAQLRNEATPPLSRRNSNASIKSSGSRRSSNTSVPRPLSRRNSSRSAVLPAMEPKVENNIDLNKPCSSPTVGERSIGCSDAFKLLDGRVPVDDDHMDWRHLKPVPHASVSREGRRDIFTMEPGMYSAMELDASSILTTLQHAPHPLKPRPSDGTHASLVRIAEERRKAGDSPMTNATDEGDLGAVSQFNMAR